MFSDSLFILLKAYCDGDDIPISDLNDLLRKCDDKLIQKNGVWLSEKARLSSNKNKHYSNTVGFYLEHIITVEWRVDILIWLYSYKFVTDRKDLKKFIIDSFYAVLKLKSEKKHKGKKLEGMNAEQLLPKKNRDSNKVKLYEKYSSKR